MRILRTVTCTAFIFGCIGAMSGCNEEANPVPPAPQLPRDTLFHDSFETAIASPAYDNYFLDPNKPVLPFWSLSTAQYHSGKSSATSDSNGTGMKKIYSPDGIFSGTIGCEFYIMAKQPGQTNFTVFIGAHGSSAGGCTHYIGMGFDKSDSVKCLFYESMPVLQDYTTVAKITPGHWYKCKAEYSFDTKKASYYLDDVKVGEVLLEMFTQFGAVVAHRDTCGSQGPKEYYLDDLLCYKLK